MKPELHIGISGYETTQTLLLRVISLIKEGQNILFVTSDSSELVKLRIYDLMLEDKPSMQEKILLNKREISIPNKKGYRHIEKTYGKKLKLYQAKGLNLEEFIQSVTETAAEHQMDVVIIDSADNVLNHDGYESRNQWFKALSEQLENVEGLRFIFSVHRVE